MEVLELGPDDWPRWRALRQAALGQAPEAFGSTLAEWTGPGDTEERWRSRWLGVPHNLVVVRDGHDLGMASLTAPESCGWCITPDGSWPSRPGSARGVGPV